MLKVIDDVDLSEEFGVASVDPGKGRLRIFAGGQITATDASPSTATELFEKGARAFLRAAMCAGCGVCEKSCEQDAIVFDDEPKIDETKCTHCGTCVDSCVVAHYFDKLSTGLSAATRSAGKRRPKAR